MNIVAHMDHLLREREQVARDLTSEDRVRAPSLLPAPASSWSSLSLTG